MKDTIKLSENFGKAICLLKEVRETTTELKNIFDKLDNDEKNMLGGLVIGIYSPIKGGPCMNAVIGNTVYCQGLISELYREEKGEKREESLSYLLGLLSRRGNDN